MNAFVARSPKVAPAPPAPPEASERGVAPRFGRFATTMFFAPSAMSDCTPPATACAAVAPALSISEGLAAVAGALSTGMRSFGPASTVKRSVREGTMPRC